MNMHEPVGIPHDTRLSLRVASRAIVAENIVAFELEAFDFLPLPAFEAGAHLEIDCDGMPRQYSLCGDPADPMRYRIAVQNEANGRGGSRFLCESVQIGDTLDARGPRNHFPLAPAARAPLLIAGGIGITPMLSMAWALHATGNSFEFHDFAATRERQAFVDDIARAPWAAQTTRHIGPCENFAGLIGGFEPGRHLYVCGPLAMIDGVLDTARALGWPEDHLHCERFGAPSAATAAREAGANTPFEVELASSGRRIPIAADQTVCNALAEAGVRIPVSCEHGVCGSCITRVLDGVPDHRDWILTDAQQTSGKLFTPCCSRAKTPRLVLDL